jgi:glycosyltransferase involved in cell wall biosynthesis
MGDRKRKEPIRIGIDGRLLMHYEMRGFARHTVELFRAMKEVAGKNVELVSFSPGPIASEFLALLDLTPVVFEAAREVLWEQVELPRQLQRNAIDIFHVTGNRGLPYRHVCKYVVTCHDIIDRLPDYCDDEPWRGRFRKAYADFASRHSADQYITVSEFSKQDICRFHGLAPDKVVVICNAASSRFHERLPAECISLVRDRYRLPRQYLLFLGGFDRRKNVAMLVDAYALLSHDAPPLVLAGEHKWDFSAIAQGVSTLGLADRVLCPGVIADEDLPAIYQAATALVHPSRYEGFGLQLVEAMASGIPVVASGTTSLPEVLGGCGLLFDPDNAASIAQQVERVVGDADLRRAMGERGQRRACDFSWKIAAQETLAVYQDLLGSDGERLAIRNSLAQEQRR